MENRRKDHELSSLFKPDTQTDAKILAEMS